jgi:hypothetical protein
MKYRTKVGMEFKGVKVTVEEEKESTFHSWKSLSVLCLCLIAITGIAYAYVTGDKAIFNKTVDAVVDVATKQPEKENGKEK